MARVLIVYYSTYDHIETMAKAVAEGARSVEGAEVAKVQPALRTGAGRPLKP